MWGRDYKGCVVVLNALCMYDMYLRVLYCCSAVLYVVLHCSMLFYAILFYAMTLLPRLPSLPHSRRLTHSHEIETVDSLCYSHSIKSVSVLDWLIPT